MAIEFDESKTVAVIRGQDPLFDVKLVLDTSKKITEEHIQLVDLVDFKLYPQGPSQIYDFDILAHIELEPEKIVEEGNEDDSSAMSEEEQQEEVVEVKKYQQKCQNIEYLWLRLSPSKDDF